MVEIGQVYQHYKGKRYKVLAVGRHSETEEVCVVYQGMYHCETFGDQPVWIRPLTMFLEKIEIDGKKLSRFEHVASD